MPIVFNEEPLPADDPLFTDGVRIGFVSAPPVEDADVELVQPNVPGRYTLAAAPKPHKD